MNGGGVGTDGDAAGEARCLRAWREGEYLCSAVAEEARSMYDVCTEIYDKKTWKERGRWEERERRCAGAVLSAVEKLGPG